MTTTLDFAPGSADPVAPVVKDGRHVLAWDDVSFEVDPATGGRITGLRLGGRNLLVGPDVDPGNYGSTFWTSPQSGWGWPPVPEIDSGACEVSVEPDAIVMWSAPSAALGVDVEKRFSADRTRGAVVCDFRIRNRGAAAVQMAPWQITRVPAGGLTFFPTGAGPTPPSNLVVQEALGVTWYADAAGAVTDHQKLFADGREGWLAHLDGDALLVKTFEVVPRVQQAPGEAQIEIYANPLHTYVEVEVQGAYDSIAPGMASAWRVVWLVRRLPAGPARSPGSAALVAEVRAVVTADGRAAG